MDEKPMVVRRTPGAPAVVVTAPPLPWYKDRAFIASICAMLTALFSAAGAWMGRSDAVEAKVQSQQNAAQIQDVHKEVKHTAKQMGIVPRVPE